MMEFETLAARRLLTALDLLTLPALEKRLENADEYRREGTKLLAALAVLEGQVTPLLQLRNTVASLGMLLSKWEANQNSEALSNEIRDLMATLETKIATQRDVLRATDYPFDHADARMSIGKFALPEMPSGDDLGALYQAGESLMNTLPQLRARMVGRLCQIAEEVEKVLGLEPLPEPPKEEPKPEAEE
jgi:hypothetical protein